MAIILKANKVNLFVSSVLFVFWYHSLNFIDTPRSYDAQPPAAVGNIQVLVDTVFSLRAGT
jgi:hypothetical protein